MTIVLGSIVVVLTLAVGALLAFLFSGLDRAIVKNSAAIENQERGYNPVVTMGYAINTQAPPEAQVKEARIEAAKRAAVLPRGVNSSTIGYRVNPGGQSASTGVASDPWTAAKIAEFHGWDGAKTGIPAGGVAAVPVAAAAVPTAAEPVELVPGKDYPYIEITDDMSADEIRKARIANSKAKSAAMKAAKAAGATAAAAPSSAPAAAVAAAASPVALGIEAPKLIPLSDDMSPDELRKARIANSKAKSAFNKALKAAGIDPSTVEIDEEGNVVMPQGAAVAAPATAAAPVAASPAALGIEAPKLIEITDDMSPDELRKARITNSKAKSAFNKALKAAGIDPSTVEIDEAGNVVMTQGVEAAAGVQAQPVAEAAAPTIAAPAEGELDAAALTAMGISVPDLVEVTDDMSPEELRQARIANSKAKSAFNKALKSAGIDPKRVNI